MSSMRRMMAAVLLTSGLVGGALASDAAETGWNLVVDENFDNPNWVAGWDIQGRGAGEESTAGTFASASTETIAILKKEFSHPAIRVECDARMAKAGAGGFMSDLSVFLTPTTPGATPLFFMFGAENNTRNQIRFGKMPVIENRETLIEAGTWYHVIATLNGRAATLEVNGKRLSGVLLPEDLATPYRVQLYTWVGYAEFNNLKIYTKDKADPVPADIKPPAEPSKTTPQTISFLRDIPLPLPEDKPVAVKRQSVALHLDTPRLKNGLYPVTFGVPFPKEQVWRTQEIRVVDRAGKEIPSQRKVTATWTKGGSIKWILLDFMADCSKPENEYVLEYGSEITAAALKPVAVQETAEAITVDTGTLKAVISKKKGSLIEAAWLDANSDSNYDRNEQMIAPGSGQAAYFVTTNGERFATDQADDEYSAIVELAGPVRTVIRTRGWYKNAKGERACYFTHRYYFYAGRSDVKLFTTWVCTRDTDDFKFQDLGLRLPLNLKKPVILLGSESNVFIEVKEPKDPVAAVQATRHAGYLRVGDQKTAVKDLDGWADLSDGQKGLCLTVYDMAEQSPVAIEADAKGLTFHAFSSEPGNILDFSIEHLRKLWGEEAWKRFDKGRWGIYQPLEERLSNGCGVSKTHFITLDFHALEQARAISEAAAVVQDPPLVFADPRWVCSSGVTYPIHPYDPERFPEMEKNIQGAFDWMLNILDRLDPRYDFWDYGMGIPHYHTGARTGPVTYTGYRREYDMGYGNPVVPWLLYLRSGDRRYWRFGMQFIHHTMDWHTQHWTHPRLQKRVGYCTADHGTWPFDQTGAGWTFNHWMDNLPLCYYLTGYERPLDVAIEVMDSHADDVKKNGPEAYEGATGLWLGNAALLYQATWDEKFRELFKTYEQTQLSSWCEYCGYYAIYPGEQHPMDINKPHDKGARSTWREYGQYQAARTPGCDPKSHPVLVGQGLWFLRNGGLCAGSSLAAWEQTHDPRLIAAAKRSVQDCSKSNGVNFSDYAGLAPARQFLIHMTLAAQPGGEDIIHPMKMVSPRIQTMPIYLVHETGKATEAVTWTYPRVMAPDGRNVTVDTVMYEPILGEWKIAIPATAPSGAYQLTPVKSDTSVWAPYSAMTIQVKPGTGVMFGAQHGAWVEAQSIWINVPEGTRTFRVQTGPNQPYTLFPPKGDPLECQGGMSSLQVPEGTQGRWEIRIKGGRYNFVIFYDIPACFAATPETFRPIDPGLRAALPESEPLGDREWMEGVFPEPGGTNKALRISGTNRTWKIPLGEKAGEAGRRCFNVQQGTIEFFFKINTPPDLGTAEGIPLWLEFENKTNFHYWNPETASFLTLEPVSAIWICNNFETHRIGELGLGWPGIGMIRLTPGRWYHLAIEWKLNDGKGKLLRRSYLNGVPFVFGGVTEPYAGWPTALRLPPQIDDHIRITSRGHDLTMDELRISDIPRYEYEKTFMPPKGPYPMDAHTLLLLHLDGTLEAGK